MKVALVIEWIDPWRGGAETSTSQFVGHLRERGVEVTLVTRSRLSPAPGFHVHTVNVKSPFRSRQAILFARRAGDFLRRGSFDVVHAISPCSAANVYEPRGGTVAETMRRNLAIRPAGVVRGLKRAANRLNLKQRKMLEYERRWLGGANRPWVIAISRYVGRQLEEHYAYPRSLIHHAFNGVDPDAADEAARRANRTDVRRTYRVREADLLVIMVAHNFRLKGVRRWLEALKRLSRETDLPVRSLVIGKDSSIRWERIAARDGLDKRIQFTGPTRRIASFFHAADILVHPTYYDPCSRVVLEALASGLPAITTRYDGAAEAITPGVNGLVLDDDACVGGLVDGVVHLSDPTVRARMAAEARRSAAGVTMAEHAEKVLQVYRSIPGNAGAQNP